MYFQLYAYRYVYCVLFNMKFFYIRLSFLRWFQAMKNFKFCFYFCLQYALSHTIPLYVFGLSFLFQYKVYLLFYIILKQNGCPFTILRLYLYCNFKPIFVHVTYTIYFANVQLSVNLTLHTVTSIHNIQEMDEKQVKTQKQDESCSVTSRKRNRVDW